MPRPRVDSPELPAGRQVRAGGPSASAPSASRSPSASRGTRPARADAPPTIPGYTLDRLLGGGALSLVYAATDDAGEPVAVKVFRKAAAADPWAATFVRRELRAGLAVRHPHLIRVHSGNVLAPPWFLVLELLPGESARLRLTRSGALVPPAAVAVGRQVAAALAALHKAGYAHADVKPENVRLVSPGAAKLLDLGFAHKAGENDSLHAIGQVLGTPNYLAPEMCASPPRDGPAADVFALGVMLFELLAGVLPYPVEDVAGVIHRRRTARPSDLRDFGPFPAGVPEAVARMLTPDPDRRPTAAKVADELTALQIRLLKKAA